MAFLAFNDIQSDYYQIPTEDKEKITRSRRKNREDLKNTNPEEINNNGNENNKPETLEPNNDNNENNGNITSKNDEEKKL